MLIRQFTTESLQDGLLNHSYAGPSAEWLKQPAIQFFQDANNIQYAFAVMNFYSRDIPLRNDKNKWDDLYKFYQACKYFKTFNLPLQSSTANCQKFNDLVVAIDAEKANVLQVEKGVAANISTGVLNDIKTWLQTQFATLSCQTVINNQQQQQQVDIITQVADKALEAPSGQADQQKKNTTLYIVYAVAAIIVVVVIVKIFKR